jgi:uncharacterized protein
LASLRCFSLFPVSDLKKLTLNEVRERSRLSLEAAEGFESLPLRHFSRRSRRAGPAGKVAAGAKLCMVYPIPMPDAPFDLPACAGCGSCCHLVVELAPGVDDVPESLVVEHAGVRCMEQRGDGACVALDPATLLCTIYERRPQVCRSLKRGESLCRRAIDWYGSAPPALAGLPS